MKIDAKIIRDILSNYDIKNKLSILIAAIQEQYQEIDYFYCRFNAVDNALIGTQEDIRFSLSDETNPLIYTLLTQRSYFIQNMLAIPEFPSAQLDISELNGQCILFPINKLGVLGLHSMKVKINSPTTTEYLHNIVELFTQTQAIHHEVQQLKQGTQSSHQEFLSLQKRDANLIKKAYINKTWIDFSGYGVSFKRDILFYSQTNNSLNIIGEKGLGKTFLALLIKRLRNTYVNEINMIDLSKIKDIVQLNSLFRKNSKSFHLFDLNNESNTLILKNLDCLSPVLINALYEQLKDIESKDVKLITTVTDRIRVSDSSINQFFFNETLNITNRLINKQNFNALSKQFIRDFCKDNLKEIKYIGDDSLDVLRLSKKINHLDNLRSILYLACDAALNEKKISKKIITEVLQIPTFTKTFNLTDAVVQYEKKLILKSLILNNWSQKSAAKDLGLPRRTLNYRCNKLNITNKM